MMLSIDLEDAYKGTEKKMLDIQLTNLVNLVQVVELQKVQNLLDVIIVLEEVK